MTPRPRNNALIGHWPLENDAQNIAPGGLATRNHGVSFGTVEGRPAARFDGERAWLEVADHPALQVGADDFTLTLQVHTDPNADTVGDLLQKFDPATRTGWNLGVLSAAGVTTSQPHYRNLFFGIDDGQSDAGWTDCGRPGGGRMIYALAVYAGRLYAGIFDGARDRRGRVYRYAGGRRWIDCGSPDAANAAMSLAVFDGHLYCATGRYKAWGSHLPDSPNAAPGGHVWRYEGGQTWTDCGQLTGPGRTDLGEVGPRSFPEAGKELTAASCLTAFRGKLYAAGPWHQGVFEYDGHRWRFLGPAIRLMALTVFHDTLYALCNEGGEILRYEGEGRWTSCGRPPRTDQSYAAIAYEGEMQVATWPEALVFQRDGATGWTPKGRLGEEKEVMGMMVYNGALYAGTLPAADVFRYEGADRWRRVGRLDTAAVEYRRVWTMAVHQGQLFAGTLPGGRVWRFQAGAMATHDHPFPAGWRQVAAVREAGRLKLYVEGRLVARSKAFPARAFDRDAPAPLRIGRGAHDFFRGALRDLRLYRRALSPAEIRRQAG